MKNLIIKTVQIFLVLFLFACGETGTTDDGKTAEELYNEAVTAFNAADYTAALDLFQQSFNKDDATFKNKAAIGIGYSYLKLSSLNDAKTALDDIIASDATNEDALAGLTLIDYALGSNSDTSPYSDAITHGNSLLSLNSAYSLSFYTSINHNDILHSVAASYYRLGDYDNAFSKISAVDNVNPDFSNSDSDFLEKLQDLIYTVGLTVSN